MATRTVLPCQLAKKADQVKQLTLVVGLCILGFLGVQEAAATNYTLLMFQASDGTQYALSTLTSTGSCVDITDGKSCTSAGRGTSVTNTTGCGTVFGGAMCLVIGDGWNPVFPMGTSTLECDGKSYEVSDGGGGQCSPNDGISMNCSQAGTSNFANASCETGCGTVSGTGSCKVK
jgi:hypothetical protein